MVETRMQAAYRKFKEFTYAFPTLAGIGSGLLIAFAMVFIFPLLVVWGKFWLNFWGV